ncbi:3-dehydroquinate synthase [Bacteroidia bacterium]|nr:3-dehydroquinate synthase [Bacteroidia bacterium]
MQKNIIIQLSNLREILSENYSNFKIVVLVDENTERHCLPIFKRFVDSDIDVIKIQSGEANKTLETFAFITKNLIQRKAEKKTVLINLGGGVVSDIGGFVASTFKRGIGFINVPTTLLAMVDAAIGGKTGVDYNGIKNVIGIINPADFVVMYPAFINTLDKQELLSGFAEMIKTALIADENLYEQVICSNPFNSDEVGQFIEPVARIKYDIVQKDMFETGLRQVLNFGHTFGHAIESLALLQGRAITHGQAVAQGMIYALYLSKEFINAKNIIDKLVDTFGEFALSEEDYPKIIDLMQQDKKNQYGNINFILLEKIGVPVINKTVSIDEIYEVLGRC